MSEPTAEFQLANLGDWGEAVAFEVRSEQVREYARVTGDVRSSALAGEIAPPVFTALAVWDALGAATARTVPSEIGDLAVHLTQDFCIHAPLTAGAEVSSRAATIGVFARRSGAEVAYRAQTHDAAGRLLAEQWLTELYRGVWPAEEAGHVAPLLDAAPDRAPDRTATIDVRADITEPYAAVSGDDFAIHLDDDFARGVGLPGRIVHGLCTMALAANALLRSYGRNVDAVAQLGVRFSRPLLPGRELRVSAWDKPGGAVAYTATAGDDVVLRNGLLRLR